MFRSIERTDRSDFLRYSNVEMKSRLRWLIFIHFLLVSFVLLQLFTYHCSLFPTFVIPRPHLWQYLWLFTVIPSICAFFSLTHQRIFLMKIFFGGTSFFGFGIILVTILVNFSDLLAYRRLKINHQFNQSESQTFFGYPLIVLWYIFLIITLQIHSFSLYFSHCLLTIWQKCQLNKEI